jgi:hypothetical protein
MRQITQSNTNTTESIINEDEDYTASVTPNSLISPYEQMLHELSLNLRQFLDSGIEHSLGFPILYPSPRMYEFLQLTNQYTLECGILFTESGLVFIERVINSNPYRSVTPNSILSFFLELEKRLIELYTELYENVPSALIEENVQATWRTFLNNLETTQLLDIVSEYQGPAFVGLLLIAIPILQWSSLLDLFELSVASNNQLHHFHLLFEGFSLSTTTLPYDNFVNLMHTAVTPLSEIHNTFLSSAFQEKVRETLTQVGNDAISTAGVTQQLALVETIALATEEINNITSAGLLEIAELASTESLYTQATNAIVWIQGHYIEISLIGGSVVILWTLTTQLLLPGLSQYYTHWLNQPTPIRLDLEPLQAIRTDALFTPTPVIEVISLTPDSYIETTPQVVATLPPTVVIVGGLVIVGFVIKKIGIVRLFHFFK